MINANRKIISVMGYDSCLALWLTTQTANRLEVIKSSVLANLILTKCYDGNGSLLFFVQDDNSVQNRSVEFFIFLL